VFLFWRIGQRVNSEILHHQRAEYGQKIVMTLATQLVASYGRSFESRNLRRMMQFAEQFPDFGIVSPLATQLSWSHVVEVLALKTPEARPARWRTLTSDHEQANWRLNGTTAFEWHSG
jgi:hypothetical protein